MMLKCFPFVFRPLTAYELFFKETQAAVRTKNPMVKMKIQCKD